MTAIVPWTPGRGVPYESALVAEIEALQAVVRLFLVDNDEHISYAITVHGELKVWLNGEKNYLSPSAAEAALRAVDNASTPPGGER